MKVIYLLLLLMASPTFACDTEADCSDKDECVFYDFAADKKICLKDLIDQKTPEARAAQKLLDEKSKKRVSQKDSM